MPSPKPPRRGHRKGNSLIPGGRRHTDPGPAGIRVAVLQPIGGTMADNLKQTGKPDDARINPDQDHELAYWSEKLGVSREELRKAVQAAGPMVKDVQKHLNR